MAVGLAFGRARASFARMSRRVAALVLALLLAFPGVVLADNVITVTPRADVLTGTSGKDTINGRAGNDRIGAGNDRISAGTGNAAIAGGAGNDVIKVRDSEVDQVSCGPARDRVIADPQDKVAHDCEVVQRG